MNSLLIHPRLRGAATLLRLLRGMLGLLAVLLAGVAMLGGILAGLTGLWPALFLIPLGLGGAWGMHWIVRHPLDRQQGHLALASRLLYEREPRCMRLHFSTGVLGWEGPLAALSEGDGSTRQAVVLQVSKFGVPKPGEHEVRVWMDAGHGPVVVIELTGKPLLALLRTRAEVLADGRRFDRVLHGLSHSLLAVSLTVPLYFAPDGWQAWQALTQAKASAAWPTAPGEILRVDLLAGLRSAGKGRTRKVYWVELGYRYRVAGRELAGNRIAFGTFETTRRGEAEALAARYPAGQEIVVAYAPDTPEEAVLEPGTTAWAERRVEAMTGLAVSLLVALIAVTLLLRFGRRLTAQRLQGFIERL